LYRFCSFFAFRAFLSSYYYTGGSFIVSDGEVQQKNMQTQEIRSQEALTEAIAKKKI
jgi:hypothetical protein